MSWTCQNCNELNDDVHSSCWKCKLDEEKAQKVRESGPPSLPGIIKPVGIPQRPEYRMPCSTTPTIPGREILSSRGIVCGEVIITANVVKNLSAGVTSIVGGRIGEYESELRESRGYAVNQMMEEAYALGADAVVGVTVDYEAGMASMLMVCASGTAVKLKENVRK